MIIPGNKQMKKRTFNHWDNRCAKRLFSTINAIIVARNRDYGAHEVNLQYWKLVTRIFDTVYDLFHFFR